MMGLYEYTIRTCDKKDILKTIKSMAHDYWEFICSCPIDISDRELYFKRLKTTQYPSKIQKSSDISLAIDPMYFVTKDYSVTTTLS